MAAAGESTRRSDEAKAAWGGEGLGSLGPGSFRPLGRVDRLQGGRRRRGRSPAGGNSVSQKTQIPDAAPPKPHSVPLHSAFFTFQFGAFRTGLRPSVEGATQTSSLGAIQSLYSGFTEVWSVWRKRPETFIFDLEREAEATMVMCTQFQMSVLVFLVFFLNLERKTQKKTKDVYIYDCYNFNWYILLNGKHFDRIPQRHMLSHLHKHGTLGMLLFHFVLFISQTNRQTSPFTSNFTS